MGYDDGDVGRADDDADGEWAEVEEEEEEEEDEAEEEAASSERVEAKNERVLCRASRRFDSQSSSGAVDHTR